MSTTTNTTILDQDTITATPAPSTNSQAGGTAPPIKLSSQCAAVDALLGYMTSLTDMMNDMQKLTNDRLVNQWDYIDYNQHDMLDMANDQFKSSMSSAIGSLAGAGFLAGSSLYNFGTSRDLNKTLDTQQAEKNQLEELDRFLRGAPGGNDAEIVGGDANQIEMNQLGAPVVPDAQRDAILNGLRRQNGGNFLDEELNPKIANKATAIRNIWDDVSNRPGALTDVEKGHILNDLDRAIASKKEDIKATQTELSLKQESSAQWGKALEGLCTAGGTIGQAQWGKAAKMDERASMLDSAVEKSMEQAVQNTDGSIKTFANQLSSLADALQKTLYVQQRA